MKPEDTTTTKRTSLPAQGRRPGRRPDENGDPDLVRFYLDEIGMTPLLTAEQEVDLSKRIEAGLFAERLLAESEQARRQADRREAPRWSWSSSPPTV